MLIFVIGIGFALVLVAATASQQRRRDERRWLGDLLDGFGKPVERERDLTRLRALHLARQAAEPALPRVDERAWTDLDMDLVFAALDRTASQTGAQCLYDRLRRPEEREPRAPEMEALAGELGASAGAREQLARDLMPLREWHASYLANLLWDEPPRPHRFGALFPVLGLLPLALAVAGFLWPRLFIAALGAALVNMLVRIALRSSIDPYVPGLRALPAFIRVAHNVAGRSGGAGHALRDRVRLRLPELRFLRGAMRWIAFESGREASLLGPIAELGGSLQEYLNTAFLLDLNAFRFAGRRIRRHAGALREVFDAIGSLDVALAVASVRAGAGLRWTRPVFTNGPRRLEARGLVHPLLPEPVANDVVMDGRSWLVTGSNMSGKSTLLRTVGVNALLARSLGTVLGTHWEGPAFTVRTCIGRGDSIVAGKSYYLAEAEAVRDLLQASAGESPHLFILDELFRGTNTVERIAAGRAVLAYLDRGPHLVMVATHDIELTRWLGERYGTFHFREQVENDELTFDYLLKPGVSSTRNAIALLEALGYPEEVVQAAALSAASDSRDTLPVEARSPAEG